MEMDLRNQIEKQNSLIQVESLKTLTKLLLHEIEKLAKYSISQNNGPGGTKDNLNDKVQKFEIDLICQALIAARGNQRKAAKILGTKSSTLHAKIRRYQIDQFPVFSNFFEA